MGNQLSTKDGEKAMCGCMLLPPHVGSDENSIVKGFNKGGKKRMETTPIPLMTLSFSSITKNSSTSSIGSSNHDSPRYKESSDKIGYYDRSTRISNRRQNEQIYDMRNDAAEVYSTSDEIRE